MFFTTIVWAAEPLDCPADPDCGAEEVLVYGATPPQSTTLSPEEMRRVPASLGDPIRAIQSLPGVARPQTAEGDLPVRGAEGLATRVLLDGVPLPYLYHFGVGRSVVHGSLVDEVTFRPGALPLRYGQASQAVLEIRTDRVPRRPGLHGEVALDPLDASFAGMGQLGRFDVQTGLRMSWIGALASVLGPLLNSNGLLTPRYGDASLLLATESGRDRWSLSAIGAFDDVAVREFATSDAPARAKDLYGAGFARLSARWERGPDHAAWIAAGPSYERSELGEALGLLSWGVDSGRRDGWSALAVRQDRFALAPWLHLETGAEASVRTWTLSLTDRGDSDGMEIVAGPWLALQPRVGPFDAEVGSRLSLVRTPSDLAFVPEPRASLGLALGRRLGLNGFVGRLVQANDPAVVAAGTKDVPPLLDACQAVVGAELDLPSGWSFDVSGYGTRFRTGVVRDLEYVYLPSLPGDLDTARSSTRTLFRPADGYAWGLEWQLRLRATHGWFGWIGGTIGRSVRRLPEGELPADTDEPVSAVVVLSRDLPAHWNLSGKLRVTSGHPYTPLLGVYDPSQSGAVDPDQASSLPDPWLGLPGEPNSDRFPLFHQLDLRVEKAWIGRHATWTLSLDLFNALNTKNPVTVNYDANYQELVPEIWIPVLPVLGLGVRY